MFDDYFASKGVDQSQVTFDGYAPAKTLGYMLSERGLGSVNQAFEWPTKAAASAVNFASRPYDTVVGIGQNIWSAASSVVDWATSPIPAQGLERAGDKLLAQSDQQAGGLIFDVASGLITAEIGGFAVKWVGGKWVQFGGGAKATVEVPANQPVSKPPYPVSQADGDFGYLNQPGPSKPAAFFDTQASAKAFIDNGRINISDLERLVPPGTPNSFQSSATIAAGSKFQYKVNGQNIEVKWHAPDANAAERFPGSNSGSGWTAQLKIGGKLLGQDGLLYRKPSNSTHIPVDF
ncbi:hypothetical protein [Pseudomonas syringae]|uniref:hypothetical protein n=1 Tax=Pseudomonas syringae TaxID=317 RepID=UPI00200A6D75|nr:hypothetical protein [Pseudomonas syringae]MCK9697466.1 hypothetical protein [Pseudomonas syringae pv. syringae]MCK9711973.1 hypothetical protein [Pseudomonas syringae pv. syringae]MCK9727883.1 hypothetical protein [Pseudomonas syringae pv. syringae]MCK9737277.1 hypothetical protein [Pseudomonas syringae pv. syringae]MCK9748795.1 hypothetical protein [Pseudomonas syringae pv. syringae]